MTEPYAKFYNPSEHLAVKEVTVKFKGRVIFRQYISKKKKVLASKFTNFVMNQGIHMTLERNCVETHTPPMTT